MQAISATDDNVRWLRPQEPRDLSVRVCFNGPVEGDGDDDLLVFQRDLRAVAVRQDNGQTQFVGADGTVVAAWDSCVIERIEWPDGIGYSPSMFNFWRPPPRSHWPSKLRKLRESRPNAYMRWEPDEDERLAAESREGKTIGEMADLHGRGESAILSRLIKLNLVNRDA